MQHDIGSKLGFDEKWYLTRYPDIAAAVARGACVSGYAHYVSHGKAEGRYPRAGASASFDDQWYARAYPLAVEEVGSRDAAALEQHYRRYGRFRGYLPYAKAERPKNAAEMPSEFGGLWVDSANAHDLVRGKLALGWITADEAQQLDSFIDRGFIVLPSVVPSDVLDRAEEALEAAYHGRYPDLLFSCPSISSNVLNWDQRVLDHPAKALDLHWISQEIRDLGFHPSFVRFLHILFERPALASQSLGFYRGSAQSMHQDSAYVAYSLPQQFSAAWIALEDVKPGGGELMYFPESHRKLPEFLYGEAYKSVPEAERALIDREVVAREDNRHGKNIKAEAERLDLKRELFMAKRGDVLLWHSDLAHGGSEISRSDSRKSVVLHYSPKEVAPLFMEYGRREIRKHNTGMYYTSTAYTATST
jgi:hypothetical protein